MLRTAWCNTTRGTPGCAPKTRLSTDGMVAPVTATLQPSQLMPANQNACTFSSGPKRVDPVAAETGSSICSVMAPDGIPNRPRCSVSW